MLLGYSFGVVWGFLQYPVVPNRNPGKIDESFTRAMSINAALLANVVLASRLDSSTEVFAVLVFGIE